LLFCQVLFLFYEFFLFEVLPVLQIFILCYARFCLTKSKLFVILLPEKENYGDHFLLSKSLGLSCARNWVTSFSAWYPGDFL